MPTHAEAMARRLAARGVQYVFGLPGGEIVAFIDACRRAGLEFLLTGHESSAAWMAQVIGQMTGVPGICASTLGPGATNLVTGVANAWLDRAPMLAVTAQIPAAVIDTMTHQRLLLNELFAPITKGSFSADHRATAALIDACMDLAAAPRPGPVHIALASDLAHKDCGQCEQPQPAAPMQQALPFAAFESVAARLNAAARPIVLIGLGATCDTAPAIGALIEKLGAPFLVTPKAKGIVTEDHPLFLGVASGMAIDRDIVETIRSADLVLGIGFDPVECDKTWFAQVEVAALDSARMAEGDYRPLEAVGAIASLVTQLTERIAGPKRWPKELLERRRSAIVRKPMENGRGVSPLRLLETLRALFPNDGIATCDVGSHKLIMGQFWRSYEPGTFLMSNGLSGMGFGVPAAIAAQLARPEKRVMALVGDGGMLMMLHDLALIRERALPILIVVLSDGSLSLIRVSEERRGFPPYGVDFSPPDFAAIANAFGIAGARATNITEARECAERAIEQRTPFVLDVAVDYREYYDLV